MDALSAPLGLEERNAESVMQALAQQDAKIAEQEERIRVLTNHVMTLEGTMRNMHMIQAAALQAKYAGGTPE